MRSEQEIFDDLAALCVSQGYIHAVAKLCFRDNVVSLGDELRREDLDRSRSKSCLIRTEMTTLIGLMLRSSVDFSLPPQETVSEYVERSEALLKELHSAMKSVGEKYLTAENAANPDINPFSTGDVLREPIFYGAESAYTFQYRDLAPLKYRCDADWLRQNKGIDMEVAHDVCRHIKELLEEKLMEIRQYYKDILPIACNILPGFIFSCDELSSRSGHTVESIRAFVEAFTESKGEGNPKFTSIQEYNSAYAYPFIKKEHDEFVLLQYLGLVEALYETPFYWMIKDKIYNQTASKHRGEFPEAFAAKRLRRVFGADHVFLNVDILNSKGTQLGEIDVLVIFGDRAIVLQAKSKKLTLAARKGNDGQLQGDFKSAVQDAVDQAFDCAELLGDPSVTLRCKDGRKVPVAGHPQTIFPVSIVTDHYPALAFQVRQFLKPKSTQRIVPPLVTDVFALDAITEMLESPLRLLSYLSFRACFGDKLVANHEYTFLSYHLTSNLWVDSEVGLMVLADDISSDLEIAMAARRNDVPGAKTPKGILTRFEGTPFASLIAEIENRPVPEAIDLGLVMLEFPEATIHDLNDSICQVLARTARDGGLHGESIYDLVASTGLTIHCSQLGDTEADALLRKNCELRKYLQKADCWLGLALRPEGSIQLAGSLTEAWKFDAAMEAMVAKICQPEDRA